MNFKNYLFVLALLVFVSCKKENMCDCFKSNGKDNVIYHDVKDFTCIEGKDKVDIILTQGSEYEVKVEAGANLQKLIRTTLEGETLKVHNDNKCNWVRGYKKRVKVYITAPYFKHIKNAGLGTISNTGTITQDEISIRVENSGDVKLNLDTKKVIGSVHGNGDSYLSGTTEQLFWNYNGTNYLYAKDLTINSYAYLVSLSIGHAYLAAPNNGLMEVEIDRTGNVYYQGSPSQIKLRKNNKGDLIKE